MSRTVETWGSVSPRRNRLDDSGPRPEHATEGLLASGSAARYQTPVPPEDEARAFLIAQDLLEAKISALGEADDLEQFAA